MQAGKQTGSRLWRFSAGYPVLVFLLILLLSLCGIGCEQKKQESAAVEAPEVDLANVIQKDVPIFSEWVGTTDGLVNAKIRAQVTGYLMKQNYREGVIVKKGDLLFEIDPRTFKAALDQAEGLLAQAKARLGKTELDVKRYTPLAKEGAISKQELDDAIQSNLAAKASVQSAGAAVEQARLSLSFTRITSPIDGIAGSANAQIGDLVGPQTSELTTVSTIDPIKVYFSLSEREYLGFAEKINASDVGTEKSREAILDLILANESVYPHKGKLSYADRQVDVKTGTIRIAALFPNKGNMLRPGQFARVRVLTETRKDALLVPQRSVTELQGSYQLAVVGSDDKVQIRPIKAGGRIDNLWIIDEGLKPGERVITEGVQKVKQGQVVKQKAAATQPQPVSASSPASRETSSKKPTDRKE
ncbi:MAG: efflux RND transporter periplasmic adaptor subunit [Syntrophobacteraceae bacterium]